MVWALLFWLNFFQAFGMKEEIRVIQNPLAGFTFSCANSQDYHKAAPIQLIEKEGDSKDTDEKADTDDSTDPGNIELLHIHIEDTLFLSNKSNRFEYADRLSQAHVRQILTPPDYYSTRLI